MPQAGHPKGQGQERKVPYHDKSKTASKGMAEHEKGHTAGTPDLPEELDDRRPQGQVAKDAMEDRAQASGEARPHARPRRTGA